MTDVNVLGNTRFCNSIRKVVRLVIDNILRTAASFPGRLINLTFDVITIEDFANLHADNRNILMLHGLTFVVGRNAKQKKQFLAEQPAKKEKAKNYIREFFALIIFVVGGR